MYTVTLKEEYENLMKEIKTTNFNPNETGYLISSKFVKDFEDSIKTSFPPDPIDNNDIKRKGKFKPNMKQNVDYFVITRETWEKLIDNYTGGPEVTCSFDSLGNANIYPITLTLNYKGDPMVIKTTKVLPLETLIAQIRAKYEIPENHIIQFYAPNSTTPIDILSLTTIDPLSNYPKIEITVEIPKPPKLQQDQHNQQQKRSNEQQQDQKISTTNQLLKIVGLKNLGNTCYMNASIQSFLSLPNFTERIDEFQNGEVSLSFQTLYRNILKNKSAYDPKLFKQAMGHKIPFFAGTSQQDAHEFASFFIDVIHEENRDLVTPMFYGDDEATTTCAICKNATSVKETFSSLSLPISSSRRIIFSPWDLSEPMRRLSAVPEIPVILYGTTRTGQRLAKAFTAEFLEMLALEAPQCFAEEENQGLALLKLYSGKRLICKPIITRVPLEEVQSEVDIEIIVWNRIEILFDVNSRKRAAKSFKLINPPNKFTRTAKDEWSCNEEIIVDIAEPYGDRQYGFLENRIRTFSDTISLDELVNAYFSQIQLDPQNKWRCEKCGDESCAFHKVRLLNLPENLVIQLKRFASGNKFERDNSPVSIPMQLDFAPYFKDGCLQNCKKEEDNTKKNAVYNLRAVANHIGNLDSGHYTAMGKRGNQWYLFNDSRAIPKDAPSGETEAAYLLFFGKQK